MPVPIRIAATLLLVREVPGFEVLMVQRHHQIDFAAGALVFPGGKVDETDTGPAWADFAIGWHHVPEIERGPRVAVIREAFEETGLLPCETNRPGERIGTTDDRKAVESGDLAFIDFARRENLAFDLTALTLFSRWLTPSIVPKRFDTFFYLARSPGGETIDWDGREIVDAEWIDPAAALQSAKAGTRTIMFPTRMNLKLLDDARSYDKAAAHASARENRVIEPRVEKRGDNSFLLLDPEHGYGDIEEPLELPGR